MAVLALNQPVTQADAVLQVENRLAPGRYRFRLVVIDTAGLESAPADLIVTIEAPPPPAPPADPGRPPIFRPDRFDRIERIERVLDPRIFRPRRPNG